ncbi:MAG TPA: non-homologous end-joining DNA ligase [bacterium]|jgi:bifunctional non-homologous end joining protein LigD|nr:non-homologous end-joining DNA ligase [bacterium]
MPADWVRALPDDERRRLRKRSQPPWMQPMLATLTDERFSRRGWIFEPKLDGERALAFRAGTRVRMLSRNKQSLSGSYPELAEALAAQRLDDFVVDGEVVAFADGIPSFSRLQQRMGIRDPERAKATGVAVTYYIFDLLYLEGYDVTRLSLRQRKGLLRKALTFRRPLRWTTYRNTEGEAAYRDACRRGLEGVIAKRADAPYAHRRSTDWLKFKCSNEQEFVIGGFTDPAGSRVGFGALLVGYHEWGKLRYAGKVGTGYDERMLRDLRKRLDALERDESPFTNADRRRRGVHWVTPTLVAQIGFSEWTGEGRLRHPRFLGLRRDKSPREVVRERPR